MANLLMNLLRPRTDISRVTLSEYIRQRIEAINNPLMYAPSYATGYTVKGRPVEQVEDSYVGLASYAYRGDSVVAACMRVRRDLFRQVKFCWRQIGDSGPGRVFRDDQLALLERPWPNGTTGELLTRMITDVDLCGNSFIANEGDRLRWLRPDWVTIELSGDPLEDPDIDVTGYVYSPGGDLANGVPYKLDDICHWAPEQDPLGWFKGMSWVSKALEDIQGDRAATTHKQSFFRNGATLGPIIRAPKEMTATQFQDFIAVTDAAYAGAANAYKFMYVGGGVDVTLSAADFRQLDLKAVQGGYETRIAAVAGVHPVLVGLSEGMQGSSLNAGNFNAARRATAEMTLFSLWQDACGALQTFFDAPDSSELWIREKDVPFLREERKDQAEITNTKVLTLEAGIRAGYKPDELVDAVESDDITLLKGAHTGLTSVQLLPPGAKDTNADGRADLGAGEPPDFGALREPVRALAEVDEDELIARALEAAFDEVERAYNPNQARIPKGFEGGGRFRSLADRLTKILKDWAAGEGDDDPLDEFNREQLRKTAKALADKARAAGDDDRAARLTPRRGASTEEIKLALYKDIRASARKDREGVDKPAVKKAAPRVPNAETKARERQAKIDAARKVSELLAGVDERLDNGADPVRAREIEVENKIRAAYRNAPGGRGSLGGVKVVTLAELRPMLGDMSREDQDRAFRRLIDQPGVQLFGEEDQKRLTSADREAAFDVNQFRKAHWLVMDDPSPRPMPTADPDALKATIRADAKRLGTPDSVRDELLAAVDEAREVEVENRVRAAYVKHKLPGGYAPLAEVREELSDLPRAEQDAALTRLAVTPGVSVIPWDNRKALRPKDHAASLRIGGDESHAIRFEDSSPRPSSLKTTLARLSKDAGLSPIGSAGQPARFDRKLHQGIDGTIPSGRPVRVVRPGYETTVDGERVQLSKATVEEIDEAEFDALSPKPVPKKRTPRKAAPKKTFADRLDAAAAGDSAPQATPYRLWEEPDDKFRKSTHFYTGGGYLGINEDLRLGRFDDRRTKDHIKNIDAAMADSPLTKDVRVTRGIRVPADVFGDKWNDDDVTGLTWTEKGYVSTSANVSQTGRTYFTGTSGVRMTILVPRGTQALATSNVGETELLLQRGLRLRVVRDNGTIDGVRHIDVEVSRAAPTVADLREMAKARGISIPSGARKADLLKLLGVVE